MITPEKARQDYEAAVSTLQAAAMTPGMASADRMTIRDTIRELTLQYLGQLEAEIQTLTAQYQSFIASMTAVIASLKGGTTPVSVLNQLTGIVAQGGQLIGTAAAALPSGAKAMAGPRGRSFAGAGSSAVLRILCVHGVGHQEADLAFERVWRDAITRGISAWSLARPFEIKFVPYDDLFAAEPLDAADVAEAVLKLGVSGILHGIGDLFRRRRGFGDVAETVRWTAGMIVQWAENSRLRAAARQRVLDHTRGFQPHVVLAHSLGSLLSYDAFARVEGRKLIAGRTFVSFGSQIGNPFVRSTLGGRIMPLAAAQWFHLFNPHDDAFTAAVRLRAPNFEMVDASFDIAGLLDHDAGEYLRHANTTNIFWRSVAAAGGARSLARVYSTSTTLLARQSEKARPARSLSW